MHSANNNLLNFSLLTLVAVTECELKHIIIKMYNNFRAKTSIY